MEGSTSPASHFCKDRAPALSLRPRKKYKPCSERMCISCIAEGVDSEEKFEKLVELGIKNFQGYYLSRAVKEEELDRMVRLFS